MAEAPPATEGSSPLKAITRKVGPLPLWAYAAILVVGYFLYKRMKGGSGSGTSGPAADTSQTDQNTYVPGFDAAGAGGGGGIGATGVPSTVNNYYYGDQGAGQASGGGTSSGNPSGGGLTQGPNPPSIPIRRPVDSGHPITNPVVQPFGPTPYVPRLGPFVAN